MRRHKTQYWQSDHAGGIQDAKCDSADSTVSYAQTSQQFQHKLYYEFQTGLFLPKYWLMAKTYRKVSFEEYQRFFFVPRALPPAHFLVERVTGEKSDEDEEWILNQREHSEDIYT